MGKRTGSVDGDPMKVVILAGGKGTRISEESVLRPKPMVKIGGRPILWHIMKIYASYGFQEFIICCGYKGEYIKKYFAHYGLQNTRVQFAMNLRGENGQISYMPGAKEADDWQVICANTGLETLTAGRVLAIKKYIGEDTDFMLTYGDGVADIDISRLLAFHRDRGKVLTISTTRPEGRFGTIGIEPDGNVRSFHEKDRRDQGYVNIGYMVANRKLFDYLGDGSEMLERGPFERLVADRQIAAYKHEGFWSPMDNIHDRDHLEQLWSDNAPWKKW